MGRHPLFLFYSLFLLFCLRFSVVLADNTMNIPILTYHNFDALKRQHDDFDYSANGFYIKNILFNFYQRNVNVSNVR